MGRLTISSQKKQKRGLTKTTTTTIITITKLKILKINKLELISDDDLYVWYVWSREEGGEVDGTGDYFWNL